MNTKTSSMITTVVLLFLTLFSLLTPSVALPAPAPGALSNAPASLLGRTYSYVARDDTPIARAPESEKGSEEFDKESLTRAMRFMLKTKNRRS